MLIYIDGPEAAGKTTTVEAIAELAREYGWHVVHCRNRRPWPFDPRAYIEQLQLANRVDTLVVMDRGWISEDVYNSLMRRDTTFHAHHYEWAMGRAVWTIGAAAVLVADAETLMARRAARGSRDKSDLPVNVRDEVSAFARYAAHWGYSAWSTDGTPADVIAARLVEEAAAARDWLQQDVTAGIVAGTPWSDVVVLGEARNHPERVTNPVGWLPFTGRGTEWLQHVFTAPDYRYNLYVNAADVRQSLYLSKAVAESRLVIAMGNVAKRCAEELEAEYILHLPHPAAAVRWGKLREAWPMERYKTTIEEAINELILEDDEYDDEYVY